MGLKGYLEVILRGAIQLLCLIAIVYSGWQTAHTGRPEELYITLTTVVALGIAVIVVTVGVPGRWYTALIWGAACFACGVVLGLIFGIPRFVESKQFVAANSNGSLAAAQDELEKAKETTNTAQTALNEAVNKSSGQPAASSAQGSNSGPTPDQAALQEKLREDLEAAKAGEAAAETEVKWWSASPEELQIWKRALSDQADADIEKGDKGDNANKLKGVEEEANAKRMGQILDDRSGLAYGANTNLTEISDWLTKIIVGVGLIQLGKIKQQLKVAATYISKGFCTDPNSPAEDFTSMALGIIVFFGTLGFVSSYLLARIWLPGLFDAVG